MRISPELRIVDFYAVRKTGGPGEKPLWQEREPTNNSTHIKQTINKLYLNLNYR
jgi:hypothetical protein